MPVVTQLRMWPIAVQNPATKEWLRIMGDGKTVADALADAIKVLNTPYRPKSDGKTPEPQMMAVTTHDGLKTLRTLKEFEA